MPIELSVILCTHNPRPDYLQRTLDALRAQTLAQREWELLIVDNASAEPLAGRIDVKWHGAARIVREETLGLTSARVCGIEATTGPLLVLVDDDNVLALDYLETAVQLGRQYPFLGAWGGAVLGEFEIEPPTWAKPYLGWLALRDPQRIHWGNATHITDSMPCGAGMCVRRHVATTWAAKVRADSSRLRLGRIGRGLGAGEDADLAFTACDIGSGNGVFPQLRVHHLIPARRLSLDYFERLVEEMSRAEVILRSLRHRIQSANPPSVSARLFSIYSSWRMPSATRRLLCAIERGSRAGLAAAGHGSASSPNTVASRRS